MLVVQDWDPYQGLENLICDILYGRTVEKNGKKEN